MLLLNSSATSRIKLSVPSNVKNVGISGLLQLSSPLQMSHHQQFLDKLASFIENCWSMCEGRGSICTGTVEDSRSSIANPGLGWIGCGGGA